MKKLILVVLVAFAATLAFAEKAELKTGTKSEATLVSLSGNVIDEVSGEALVGVEILVEGTDVKAYTDFDGHFVINNVKVGNCTLVASYTSYNKTEKTLKVNTKSNLIKIELQASK
jgi:hypothetical protein